MHMHFLGLAALSHIITAPAGRLASGNHAVYDRGCAANARIYRYRAKGAVSRACAAFHAPVFIAYCSLFAVHNKDRVRTHLNTPSATGACIGKEFKACHIGKIFHLKIPLLPHPLPNPPLEREGTKKFPLSGKGFPTFLPLPQGEDSGEGGVNFHPSL